MAIVSYAKSMADFAKEGARILKERGTLPEHQELYGRMCETCACRWDQEHTLPYFLAADQAAQCLMTDREFNCHTYDFKCSEKPCVGFILAKIATIESAKKKLKEIRKAKKSVDLNQKPILRD